MKKCLFSLFLMVLLGFVSWTPAAADDNFIYNGSFETGSFQGWAVNDIDDPYFPMMVLAGPTSTWPEFFSTQPTDGRFYALNGFDGGGPDTITLAQDVRLPETGVSLVFDYRAAWDLVNFECGNRGRFVGPVVRNSAIDLNAIPALPTGKNTFYKSILQAPGRFFDREPSAIPSRYLTVEVQPAGGGSALYSQRIMTANCGTLVNDTGVRLGMVDLSGFAGSSIRIVFIWTIPEWYTGPAQFLLDNIRTVQMGDMAGSVTLHATPVSGNAPLEVALHADVTADPGTRIEQYMWDLDGDGSADQITGEPDLVHTYSTDGRYDASVTVIDSVYNTGTSNIVPIHVGSGLPQEIPVPMILSLKGAKADWVSIRDTIVNRFEEPMLVTLEAIDETETVLDTQYMTVPPFGSADVDLEAFFGVPYVAMRMTTDRPAILFTDLTGEYGRYFTEIPTTSASVLPVPQVPVDTDMWKTMGYISSATWLSTELKVAGQTIALGDSFPPYIEIDPEIPADTDPEMGWARFIAHPGDAFTDARVLTGFEIVYQDGGDGGAMGLNAAGFNKLIVPLPINSDLDVDWHSMALLNAGNQPVDITWNFYDEAGEHEGFETATIPAMSKLDIPSHNTKSGGAFPGLVEAVSATVTVNGPGFVHGVVMGGSNSGGTFGYDLSAGLTTGVMPIPETPEGHMAGVVVTAGDQPVTIGLEITDPDGTGTVVEPIEVPAHGQTWFHVGETETGYFFRLNGTASFTAVLIWQNGDGTQMAAIPAAD